MADMGLAGVPGIVDMAGATAAAGKMATNITASTRARRDAGTVVGAEGKTDVEDGLAASIATIDSGRSWIMILCAFHKRNGTREGYKMNRRIFALALGLGVTALFAPRVAMAEDHLAEAISHTKEAIDHGKQGHADVLVTHAEAALKHAEAAEKAKKNEHTKQGITHLKASIAEGKKKDAAAATGHAEEALTHLEAAQK